MQQINISELLVYALVIIGALVGARWLYVLSHRQPTKALRRYTMGLEIGTGRGDGWSPLAEYVIIDFTSTPKVIERAALNVETYSQTLPAILKVHDKYRPEIVCVGVAGFGQFIYDQLDQTGIAVRPIHFTASTKRQLSDSLYAAIKHGDLLLPTEHETAKALIGMDFDEPLTLAYHGVRILETRFEPIQWTGPGRFA